jgi:hypothetical protein
LVDGGINYFKCNADVIVMLVAQNLLMVKMAGQSFGRKQNYGLTVTKSSEEWRGTSRLPSSPDLIATQIVMALKSKYVDATY